MQTKRSSCAPVPIIKTLKAEETLHVMSESEKNQATCDVELYMYSK